MNFRVRYRSHIFKETVKSCANNAQPCILATRCNDLTGYLTCKKPQQSLFSCEILGLWAVLVAVASLTEQLRIQAIAKKMLAFFAFKIYQLSLVVTEIQDGSDL